MFCYEAKILRTTFWRPDFSIWRLKKKFQSPLGACIKQLISDPVPLANCVSYNIIGIHARPYSYNPKTFDSNTVSSLSASCRPAKFTG